MATLAGYRRGATTLCHNPVRKRNRACRDSTYPSCNQRAGGTLLPERIPTPAAMPTRRLRQRLGNNSNRDPRTSPGASVY
uniref:hypothetical protein n=1 Tax=Candidatus Limisoma sp. TaxID=3076476 RepID=UPI004024E3A5